MPAIGTLIQIGPGFAVTPAADGQTFLLGGMPDQFSTGGMAMDVVPDDAFSGTITVLGMVCTKEAYDANVAPVAYPYRAFYLNGAVADVSQMQVGVPITSRSSVIIPASGQQIAILVACSAGACPIYLQAVRGSTAP